MTEFEDPRLRRRVHEEIAERMKPGALALGAVTAGLYFLTDAGLESPGVAGPLLLLTMGLNVVRFALALSFRPLYERAPSLWTGAFVTLGHAHAALWGLGSGYLIVYRGLLWSTLTVMLLTAAMAAGACSSLAPDRRLMRSYIALLLGPAIAFGLAAEGGRATTLALMHAAYFAYLWAHGGQSHQVLLGLWRNERRLQEANAALGRAKDEALEALKTKSLFLANMSHEIRTPLNGVLGMAQLLGETRLEPAQREMVQTIRRSGEHLLSLLGDILDVSRIEAGKLVLDPVPVELRGCVGEVVALLSPIAKKKGLTLSVTTRGAEASWLFLADPLRLRQILSNLVANALKFTERGGVEVTLSATDAPATNGETPASPARVRVEVKDSGPGLAAGDLGPLFEGFTQGTPSTARRFGGAGLGLHISRSLVELMGGAIGVESAPGAGATFWFELPLPRPTGAHTPAPAAPPAKPRWGTALDESEAVAPAPPRPPRVARILVAEDNPVSQEVIRAMLERLGCEVDLVTDGVQAVQRVEDDRFDLVLLDCQMPRLDGYQAADRIRSLPGAKNRIPVVAVTANSMPGDELRCLQAGMDDFLAKPVKLDDLKAIIERWIGPLGGVRPRQSGMGPRVEPPVRALAT